MRTRNSKREGSPVDTRKGKLARKRKNVGLADSVQVSQVTTPVKRSLRKSSYHLDDTLLCSQSNNEAQVGWDGRLHEDILRGKGQSITEMLKNYHAAPVEEEEDEGPPRTPPLMDYWLDSPQSQVSSSQHKQQFTRCKRLRQRGKPPGIKSTVDSQKLLIKLKEAMDNRQREEDAQKEAAATAAEQECRITARLHASDSPVTHSEAAIKCSELFAEPHRQTLGQSPKLTACRTPETPNRVLNQTAEDMWTDEDLFDDSLIRATQDLFEATCVHSPVVPIKMHFPVSPENTASLHTRISAPKSQVPRQGTVVVSKASGQVQISSTTFINTQGTSMIPPPQPISGVRPAFTSPPPPAPPPRPSLIQPIRPRPSCTIGRPPIPKVPLPRPPMAQPNRMTLNNELKLPMQHTLNMSSCENAQVSRSVATNRPLISSAVSGRHVSSTNSVSLSTATFKKPPVAMPESSSLATPRSSTLDSQFNTSCSFSQFQPVPLACSTQKSKGGYLAPSNTHIVPITKHTSLPPPQIRGATKTRSCKIVPPPSNVSSVKPSVTAAGNIASTSGANNICSIATQPDDGMDDTLPDDLLLSLMEPDDLLDSQACLEMLQSPESPKQPSISSSTSTHCATKTIPVLAIERNNSCKTNPVPCALGSKQFNKVMPRSGVISKPFVQQSLPVLVGSAITSVSLNVDKRSDIHSSKLLNSPPSSGSKTFRFKKTSSSPISASISKPKEVQIGSPESMFGDSDIGEDDIISEEQMLAVLERADRAMEGACHQSTSASVPPSIQLSTSPVYPVPPASKQLSMKSKPTAQVPSSVDLLMDSLVCGTARGTPLESSVTHKLNKVTASTAAVMNSVTTTSTLSRNILPVGVATRDAVPTGAKTTNNFVTSVQRKPPTQQHVKQKIVMPRSSSFSAEVKPPHQQKSSSKIVMPRSSSFDHQNQNTSSHVCPMNSFPAAIKCNDPTQKASSLENISKVEPGGTTTQMSALPKFTPVNPITKVTPHSGEVKNTALVELVMNQNSDCDNKPPTSPKSSPQKCTPDEIEKKRMEAMNRRRNKLKLTTRHK